MFKNCTVCKIEKDYSEFYKDKRAIDGLYSKCKVCHGKVSKRWIKQNPERVNLLACKWQKEHPEKRRLKQKRYRLNPEYVAKEGRWNAKYKSENKAKINSINAGRRAAQLQATPPWLTPKMKAEIDFFYWLSDTVSKTFGVPHHVDHIEPLLGENSRGLHVPWNLQVIPKTENLKKKNKLIVVD